MQSISCVQCYPEYNQSLFITKEKKWYCIDNSLYLPEPMEGFPELGRLRLTARRWVGAAGQEESAAAGRGIAALMPPEGWEQVYFCSAVPSSEPGTVLLSRNIGWLNIGLWLGAYATQCVLSTPRGKPLRKILSVISLLLTTKQMTPGEKSGIQTGLCTHIPRNQDVKHVLH